MELWIRNQRRFNLVKVSNLMIGKYNGYYCVETKIDESFYELGKYEAEGRVLEILDEIQSYLMSDCSKSNVYNMSKE